MSTVIMCTFTAASELSDYAFRVTLAVLNKLLISENLDKRSMQTNLVILLAPVHE